MLSRLRWAQLGAAALAAAAAAAALAAGALVHPPAAARVQHLANADDDATALRGKAGYRRYCASCHGKSLQGQPLWQLIDAYVGRRAPAHDETGHTWQHSDEALFQMTKYGRFPDWPADVVSRMPGFEKVLSDGDILDIIAFIKRRWPLGLRVSQAMLNPGYAGMPPDAYRVEWRLPPTCIMIATLRARIAKP